MLTYEVQPDMLDEVRRSKKEVCSLRGSIRKVVMRGPPTSLISSVVACLQARHEGRRNIHTVELMSICEEKGLE